MLLTALLIRRQGAMVRVFEQAGATTPAAARTPQELGVQPGMAWYQLVGQGVLRCPGEGRYYLDPDSWQKLRQHRRRITALVLAVIAVLGLLYAWIRVKAA
ncbi:hypothetical protein [Dyella sp. ASV21]|jgi:hypothetical protein|uniref:hypothetical protein n=1 Tax=Dyella sp. ASV21 TaxID=2795114 RepID=UPI0018ED53C7|nr:hypothetical protein [Dyella sp. ASV21]